MGRASRISKLMSEAVRKNREEFSYPEGNVGRRYYCVLYKGHEWGLYRRNGRFYEKQAEQRTPEQELKKLLEVLAGL